MSAGSLDSSVQKERDSACCASGSAPFNFLPSHFSPFYLRPKPLHSRLRRPTPFQNFKLLDSRNGLCSLAHILLLRTSIRVPRLHAEEAYVVCSCRFGWECLSCPRSPCLEAASSLSVSDDLVLRHVPEVDYASQCAGLEFTKLVSTTPSCHVVYTADVLRRCSPDHFGSHPADRLGRPHGSFHLHGPCLARRADRLRNP
jgi:hypothetical protein